MSNRVVMGVLIIVVLVLAGAGYTWFKNTTSHTGESLASSAPSIESQGEVQADSGAPMSLKDLSAATVSQKCTFSDPSSKSTGTVYTGQGKMRGDFTTSAQSENANSHMISDGQTAYMWSEGMAQGMKLSIDKLTSATSSASESTGNVDINKKVDYKCESWSVDSAQFQIPTNVQFSDMNAMMQQAKPSAGSSVDTSEACKACDRLSGTAKDQCKKALSC